VRTIAIVNQKGGSGKTTTAISLSAALAARGQRTLLVDLDPQSHCAIGLAIPESQIDLQIGDAMMWPDSRPLATDRFLWKARTNLDVAPSTTKLAGLESSRGGLAAREDRDLRLKRGANLKRKYARVFASIEKQFGVPAVVAINHFVTDSDAEIEAVREYVKTQGAEAVLCRHWELGSEGTEELANKVVGIIEGGTAQYAPLYPDEMPLFEKMETIARRIYHADGVLADKKIRDQLRQWEEAGYGDLPVCMAKTQYSFSTDPNLRGAPTGHSVPIREVRLSAGAGFVVAICGEIMTMPGLPKVPSAEAIRLDQNGYIEGLF